MPVFSPVLPGLSIPKGVSLRGLEEREVQTRGVLFVQE